MGMSRREKKGPTPRPEQGRSEQSQRERRLADALRKNLRKRKAQQRARIEPAYVQPVLDPAGRGSEEDAETEEPRDGLDAPPGG